MMTMTTKGCSRKFQTNLNNKIRYSESVDFQTLLYQFTIFNKMLGVMIESVCVVTLCTI